MSSEGRSTVAPCIANVALSCVASVGAGGAPMPRMIAAFESAASCWLRITGDSERLYVCFSLVSSYTHVATRSLMVTLTFTCAALTASSNWPARLTGSSLCSSATTASSDSVPSTHACTRADAADGDDVCAT
eukprot:Amastigsp_a520959_24.p2 type:complete len:132 gc:universal Amastigsp_a520959_24:477-82(-)